jgi:hypothetical protein
LAQNRPAEGSGTETGAEVPDAEELEV